MLGTYTQYSIVTRDLEKSLERFARKPEVEREVEYYRSKISSVKTIKEFVADRRLLSFAMKAFGLGDMGYAKAFMAKLLEGGRDDRTSLANRLADPRYREFAETFDFKRYGEATTVFTRVQTGVVDMYIRQSLEESEGAQNEGVRLALYFERKAASIDSVFEILGDRALGTVVRTALGLPDTVALLDIDRQKEMIEKKLKIEDLREPEKLRNFLKRFTAMWDIKNGAPESSLGATGLVGGSIAQGISGDLMLAIQKMKR